MSKIIGILPMAGKGSRLQPIGFSKELYPVIYKQKHFAISEFSVLAMSNAGADEIKLVINPEKSDIARYYAQKDYKTCMYFYNSPSLPESCLFPIDRLHDDDICLFGLPDTLFSPLDGYEKIRIKIENGADLCLGLFEVPDGSKYDSVLVDDENNVLSVSVKQVPPLSNFIWGIWGGKVKTLKELKKAINSQSTKGEKLLGVGFHKLAQSKKINFKAVQIGNTYFDIGTMEAVVMANQVVKNFKIN